MSRSMRFIQRSFAPLNVLALCGALLTATPAFSGEVRTDHVLGGPKSVAGSGVGTYDLCAYSRASGSTNDTATDTAGGTPGGCNPSKITVSHGLVADIFKGKPIYDPSVGVRGVAKPAGPFGRTITSTTTSEGATATGSAAIAIPAAGGGAPTLTVNASASATDDTQRREAAAEAKDPMFLPADIYPLYAPALEDLLIDTDDDDEIAGVALYAQGFAPGSDDPIFIWDLLIEVVGLADDADDLLIAFEVDDSFLPDVVVADVIAALRAAIIFDPVAGAFSLVGPFTLFDVDLVIRSSINFEEGLAGFIEAVPEPAAGGVFVAGLAALILVRLRRRNQRRRWLSTS